MNNIYKVALLAFLLIIILLLAYTAFRANQNLLKVCPTNAITLKNGIAVIDSLRCIGCGRCALGIPSPYNLTLFPAIKPKTDSTRKAVPITSDTLISQPNPFPPNRETKPKTKSDPIKVSQQEKVVEKEKKLIYIVDPDLCIGCRLCISPCPVNAITMVRGKAVIDTEKCISDGICINGNGTDFAGCPVSAINTKPGE